MTPEETIATEALVRAIMAGVNIGSDLEGRIQIKTIYCPYCKMHSADCAAAEKHDGECEAHPMARKAEQYRIALEKVVNELAEEKTRNRTGTKQ